MCQNCQRCVRIRTECTATGYLLYVWISKRWGRHDLDKQPERSWESMIKRASPAPRRISLLTVIAPLSNHYKKGQVDIENTAGRGRGFQVKVLRHRNLPNQIENVTLYLQSMFTNSLSRPSMGLRIFCAPSAPLPAQTVRKRIRGRRDRPTGQDRWSRKPSHPLNGVSI